MPESVESPVAGGGQVSDDVHKSIARLMLEYGRLEFADVCETWRDIERKAQGTIAIAGVFIAGVVALLTRFEWLPCYVSAILAGVILLLVVSVLLAVRGLFVSKYDGLRDSAEVFREAEEVLTAASDADAKKAIRTFVKNMADDFSTTNMEIHKVNGRKAEWVLRAQLCLACGAVVTGVLMMVLVFASWGLGGSSH
jgi:hypothetical protein